MEFVLWQLADSAFPTGGFSHSSGLEAAWQHGEVGSRDALISFVHAGLEQAGSASLPFVNVAHAEPDRCGDLDGVCDAFTTNHVANRASRVQGKAFAAAVQRIFPVEMTGDGGLPDLRSHLVFGHLAPVFGASLRRIGIAHDVATRLFLFMHVRGILAAAVRLNLVGPMDAQVLQHGFGPVISEIAAEFEEATLEDLAQTAPLLDIWQGAQDRLYSRLFQS